MVLYSPDGADGFTTTPVASGTWSRLREVQLGATTGFGSLRNRDAWIMIRRGGRQRLLAAIPSKASATRSRGFEVTEGSGKTSVMVGYG